jgi:hypothetical protein
MLQYENQNLVTSKTESKYVCRGKQGGRQMNADKGKSISSMGSQMRRENERLLQEQITNYLEAAKNSLDLADVIFLHAPGLNKTLLMSCSKALARQSHKVKSIAVQSAKANF